MKKPNLNPKGVYVPGDVAFGFWACRRPLTAKWGSGQVLDRIRHWMGSPDVIFGKTDNVEGALTVDANPLMEPDVLANWRELPFPSRQFEFGYWDPPYFTIDKKTGLETQTPHLYKKEGQEIWRTVNRLVILHTHVWPTAWLEGAVRISMVGVTMGPMKRIRTLQLFVRGEEHREFPPHLQAKYRPEEARQAL